MPIICVDRSTNFRHITLLGRLDVLGAEEIAQTLDNLVNNEKKHVIVDLIGVTCLSSHSIRLLIKSAYTQRKMGGRMVLLVGSNILVGKMLMLAGINRYVPVFNTYQDAEQVLMGSRSLVNESDIAEFAY